MTTHPPATPCRSTATALTSADSSAFPVPQRSAKLEKIATAAQRMAVSVAQVYREAHAGRLTIIKLGPRASALDAAQVDAWIAARVAEAQQRQAAKRSARP